MNRISHLLLAIIAANLLLAIAAATMAAAARTGAESDSNSTQPPHNVLKEVGIDQRLDAQLPLDLTFKDETGASIQLKDYFTDRPVILVLAYYRCPMLCTQVLNGVTKSLRYVGLEMGKDFRVLTVSFDPREGPDLAARKKETYEAAYGRPGAESGWHFLTGDEAPISQLAAAVGFRYFYDPKTDQFAHASGIMVATPQGRLSHYLLGIDFSPRDLRLALVEASQGRIGTPVDQFLLLCYHYDPSTGKYSASVMTLVRVVAIIMFLALAIPVGRSWYHDWKHPRRHPTAGPASV